MKTQPAETEAKNVDGDSPSRAARGSEASYQTFVWRFTGAWLLWMSLLLLHTLPATKKEELAPKEETAVALLAGAMFVSGVLMIRREPLNDALSEGAGR